jgi:hypothetical protein
MQIHIAGLGRNMQQVIYFGKLVCCKKSRMFCVTQQQP